MLLLLIYASFSCCAKSQQEAKKSSPRGCMLPNVLFQTSLVLPMVFYQWSSQVLLDMVGRMERLIVVGNSSVGVKRSS